MARQEGGILLIDRVDLTVWHMRTQLMTSFVVCHVDGDCEIGMHLSAVDLFPPSFIVIKCMAVVQVMDQRSRALGLYSRSWLSVPRG